LNPLHLGGFGVEVQASNLRASKELLITNGRGNENLPERYIFKPRKCPYDSIIIEGKSGHISLQALRWLSANNIPVFLMSYDGSVISSILPPAPVKADLRVSQMQAANDPEKRLTIAKALFQAKIDRSIQILDWLAQRYDIEREVRLTKREASRSGKALTVSQLGTVEARTALRYWEAYRKVLPERLRFQGRGYDGRNRNASDPFNAALNYGYGFLTCECRMAINSVGLESAVGFSHTTTEWQTKESMVLDLEEPFRWLIDLTVIQAFETGWLNVTVFEFTRDDYLYRLQEDGRKRFLHLLRERFNSGVAYKGRTLKWHTVIEEKTNELARFLINQYPPLSFQEPAPILERLDSRTVREAILNLSQSEARERGIGKSTLHYLRKRASGPSSFKVYGKVKERLATSGHSSSSVS
jgi:CRISPR-associated protein Cas1